MQLAPGTSLIPRRGGDFFWEQIFAFQELGVDMMFVAMFDEVDEATAIFKISDNHPVTDHWITLEGFHLVLRKVVTVLISSALATGLGK